MALFHRERTGEGQEVEVAMFETMASFMLVEHADGAMFDPPLGPAMYHRTIAPNRKPYRTKDGYISALIYNDKHWAGFIDAVQAGLERRAVRDAGGARRRDRHRSTALVARTMTERTTDEWLKLFVELEIPAAPLNTPRTCSATNTSTPSASSRQCRHRTGWPAFPVCRPGSRAPRDAWWADRHRC